MQVIFCDNHLLVVLKPAGISTQPHREGEENVTDQAKAWVKQAFHKPGRVFLEPVHRLDKPVSGLVLFARTSKALSRLQAMMRSLQIEKTYFAWVEGVPPAQEGVLEHYLIHDDRRALVVGSSHPKGKQARLHYKILERRAATTLVQVTLITGRYHQIRAQFAAIGCPILGDRKYGAQPSGASYQIALHQGRMQLLHPVTGQLLTLEAKAPFSIHNSAI